MAEQPIRMSVVIGASPERIYEAWLDSGEHGAFTGGEARIDARVGGTHTAWDGYIKGVNVTLDPGRRIVQTWRSLDFPEGAPDSRLEVALRPAGSGTEVTLLHSEIPEGQVEDYAQGWRDYYFVPMKRYFEEGVVAEVLPAAAPVVDELSREPLPKSAATKTQPKSKSKAKPKAKVQAKPKAKVQAKPKAKVKAKATSKAKPKAQAKAKTTKKPKPTTKTKPTPKPTPKKKTKATSKARRR